MKATALLTILSLGIAMKLFAATGASFEKSDLILLDKTLCDQKCFLVKAGNVDGKYIPVVQLEEVEISAKRTEINK